MSVTKTTLSKKSAHLKFKEFEIFARKIVNVPKKEIDEQEKIWQKEKRKEKAKS